MKSFLYRTMLIVLLSNMLIPLTQADFQDVDPNASYFPAINYYEKMKIVSGQADHLFHPNDPIKRIEFIKILMGKIDETEDLSYISIPYKDLSDTAWYSPYIKMALKKGVIRGAEKFEPTQPISRLEGIRYIYNYYKNVPLPVTAPTLALYQDSHIAYKTNTEFQVEKALEDHLFTPVSSNSLGLMQTLTRGTAADLLYQAKRAYQHTNETVATIDSYLFANVPPELKAIFLDVYQKLHHDYLYRDMVDDTSLVYAALEGMVQGLKDPYSVFFPPEASQNFLETVQGDLEGIGAYVETVNGQITIVSPLKDSPAEKAGILANDIIISIDGESTENMSLSQAVSKIRGPKGTTVTLEIQRKGFSTPLVIKVVRDAIKMNSVEYKTVGNNIAYFNIIQFIPTTPSEFTKLYQDNVTSTPRGIIIDLRNNPGGYLDSALYFLGNFLKSNEIGVRIRTPENTQSIPSYGDGKLSTIPMVVLMNKGSASASEIVTAALKDYKRAIVIGEKSYGKGVVQQLFQFNNGSSLKLTVSEWLPPLSDSINKKGIAPDIEVPSDPTNKTNDVPLKKAIEQLP